MLASVFQSCCSLYMIDVIAFLQLWLIFHLSYYVFLFRAIPGCLGTSGHFKSKFSDPVEQGHRYSATKRAVATGRKTIWALVKKISHWFLRRTKALIKEQLPKKDDRVRLIKSNQIS